MENKIKYNVTGSERQRLVGTIAHETGVKAVYKGVPSMAYAIGGLTVDREGSITWDESVTAEQIMQLEDVLAGAGFSAEERWNAAAAEIAESTDAPAAEASNAADSFTISMPPDGFTEESFSNLEKLLDAKEALIRKALGADRIGFTVADGRVQFPWWDHMPEPEEVQAYLSFIAALCAMAKKAKRVTAKEKEVESEKYAFRGFLLRLGFIGDESKAHRKLLLKNLSGSAAFPNEEKADAFSAAQKAKHDEAKDAEEVFA